MGDLEFHLSTLYTFLIYTPTPSLYEFSKDSSIARKDLNIIKSGEKIYLPADVADNLIEILKKDSEFFA